MFAVRTWVSDWDSDTQTTLATVCFHQSPVWPGQPRTHSSHSGHVQGHPPLQGQSRHLARLTLQHSDQDQQVQRNDNTHYLVYSCLCCPYCKLAHQLCWVTLSLQSAGEMCCVVTHNVDVGVATRSTRGNICLSLNQYICDQGAQIGPNID